MSLRLKRDDLVVVVAGKDKGATGRVLKVLPTGRVLIEGVNLVKRHQSPRRYPEGGIVEKEAAIDASNVMLVDPETEKPTRVRMGTDDQGKKVRIAVKSGKVIG